MRHRLPSISLLEGAGADARSKFFKLGVHLAEGLAIAVRHEDRIIAETARAARRPGERAEHLAFERPGLAVGRGERQRADEIGARVLGSRWPRARDARAPWRGRSPLSAPPQRAEWMPGAPPRAVTSSPESSASGRKPRSLAPRPPPSVWHSRRSSAPVSSGSGSPSSPADTVSTPTGANRSASSRTLPSLWVAMTMRVAAPQLDAHLRRR